MTLTFQEHCVAGVRQFVHTALVIDDRAELGIEPPEAGAPKLAVRRASPLSRARTEARERAAEKEQKTVEVPVADVKKATPAPPKEASDRMEAETPPDAENLQSDEDEGPPQESAHLNAKALTDAFLSADVICGVHKPEAGDKSVDLAVKAAKRADIVVVDWYLDKGRSTKAKAIITGILASDVQEHGRLRLVAIYTSEPGRVAVARELLAAVEKLPVLKGRLRTEPDGTTLCGSDTRICIFNKEGTAKGQDLLPVSETDLPERLICEFVKLSDGLLANFAVTAIAAVRRGAHHVLARFRNELDGAYLSHRISLKNPDEAQDLALERISVELSSLVENADVAGRTLRPPVIDAWFDDRALQKQTFKTATAKLPVPLLKEFVRQGVDRLADPAGQEQLERAAAPKTAVTKKTIVDAFYEDPAKARTAAQDFTRLTSFKREVGRMRLEDFKPHLTLGTLLKVRRDLGDAALYADIEGDFLLCVQPRCDSVRLDGPRSFPFQQAKYDADRFNLIVDEPGAGAYLYLDVKPMGSVMLRFQPEQTKDVITAVRVGKHYQFSDDRGRVLEWIADLDDMKAQRFASDIGSQMHRVGVDEFEWLRLGADGKIRPLAP